MLTEVQIDNKDGSLIPGMYAQVRFTRAQQHSSVIVPTKTGSPSRLNPSIQTKAG